MDPSRHQTHVHGLTQEVMTDKGTWKAYHPKASLAIDNLAKQPAENVLPMYNRPPPLHLDFGWGPFDYEFEFEGTETGRQINAKTGKDRRIRRRKLQSSFQGFLLTLRDDATTIDTSHEAHVQGLCFRPLRHAR